MSDFDEVKRLIVAQGDAFQEFKKFYDGKLDNISKDFADQLLKFGRPALPGAARPAATSAPTWIDVKTHRRIPVLSNSQSYADLVEGKGDPTPSIGRLMRGIVLGGRADDALELAEERKALSIGEDPSGGYTVGGKLAANWIDALRANMVLNRAGALLVPMDSKSLAIAKLTGDPVSSWHGENATLADSDPTFGALEMQAKTVTCLVKLSLELSQDASNIEEILSRALVSSMANAIDRAGLVGSATDAALAPKGLFNHAGINKVLAVGAPTNWDHLIDAYYELMLDDVAEADIGAMIGHPAHFRKMAKLKTGLSGDNSPLPLPDAVARIPRLWTTAAPLAAGSAKAIIGNWRDYLFGVRQQITVRVLNEAFIGDSLSIAVLAYARVDFAAAREQSFCSIEGITV